MIRCISEWRERIPTNVIVPQRYLHRGENEKQRRISSNEILDVQHWIRTSRYINGAGGKLVV